MASTNYGAGQIGVANTAPAEKISRVNMDVERIQSMAQTANRARERVARHTSALGYFSTEPAAETGEGSKISPISNNLQNALNDLDRALKGLHGALDLFD